MFEFNKPQLNKQEAEFEFYLDIIKRVMDPNGSFLELGPGSSNLSDHLTDVTIIDKDLEVLKRHATQKEKTLHGDFHSLKIPQDSFDYVIAIHPDLYDSENCIEWFDSEKTNFKFKDSHLEDFVLSLLNIARKKVLIVSKVIADNPPIIKGFANFVSNGPHYFVIYEKSSYGGKNGKS